VKAWWALARRELSAHATRPYAWAVGSLALLPIGFQLGRRLWEFHDLAHSQEVAALGALDLSELLLRPYFGFVAVMLLFLAPLWSMRAFTEERRTGSLVLLLSSPVAPGAIVLGKFAGLYAYFLVFLALVALMPAGLFLFGDPEPVVFGMGLLGTALLGAVMLAAGTAASSLVANPLVAAALSFSVLLLLLLVGVVADPSAPGLLQELLVAVDVWSHADQLWRGHLRLSDLSSLLGLTAFFLFVARQRVDAATWS
jgi:ABC-2 type transport system permease protein